MEYSKIIAFRNSLLVSIMLCFKCIKASAVHFPGDSSQFVLMGGEFMVLISVMWCLRSSVKHHCFGSSDWDAVLRVAGQFSTLNYKVNWCHTCKKRVFPHKVLPSFFPFTKPSWQFYYRWQTTNSQGLPEECSSSNALFYQYFLTESKDMPYLLQQSGINVLEVKVQWRNNK